MTTQWSEAGKVSEKQGLSYQMLRDLLDNIKSGSDRAGKDEFDDKQPPRNGTDWWIPESTHSV